MPMRKLLIGRLYLQTGGGGGHARCVLAGCELDGLQMNLLLLLESLLDMCTSVLCTH